MRYQFRPDARSRIVRIVPTTHVLRKMAGIAPQPWRLALRRQATWLEEEAQAIADALQRAGLIVLATRPDDQRSRAIAAITQSRARCLDYLFGDDGQGQAALRQQMGRTRASHPLRPDCDATLKAVFGSIRQAQEAAQVSDRAFREMRRARLATDYMADSLTRALAAKLSISTDEARGRLFLPVATGRDYR